MCFDGINDQLSDLGLDYNYISHIHSDSISRFKSLEILSFSFNQIGIISIEIDTNKSEFDWLEGSYPLNLNTNPDPNPNPNLNSIPLKGLSPVTTINQYGNPSQCTYAKHRKHLLKCDCMADPGDGFKTPFVGGDEGICSCKPGQIWLNTYGVRSCITCPPSTFNPTISSQNCLDCPPTFISDAGSANQSDCNENPLAVILGKDKEIAGMTT